MKLNIIISIILFLILLFFIYNAESFNICRPIIGDVGGSASGGAASGGAASGGAASGGAASGAAASGNGSNANTASGGNKNENNLINNYIKPDTPIIKGFSGDSMVKLTWIKPNSLLPILKYYIIVSCLNHPNKEEFLEIYIENNKSDLVESIIPNLYNNVIYKFNVIALNSDTISDISNTESIIPSNNNNLKHYTKNNYSSSLQSQNLIEDYYKSIDKDYEQYKIQVGNYEKLIVYEKLKDILFDKLQIKLSENYYDINVF